MNKKGILVGLDKTKGDLGEQVWGTHFRYGGPGRTFQAGGVCSTT